MFEAVLPNIRRQFIPDPGYVIVDADLQGADAQVVAWEADDEDLKQAFRDGLSVHCKNIRDMYPEWAESSDKEIKAAPDKFYTKCKNTVHGTNYIGSATTIAADTLWPISIVDDFQRRWFQKHPGIKEWHNRIGRHLDGSECWNCYFKPDPRPVCPKCGSILGNTVKNKFNYRIPFQERIDRLLPTAVAWIPQSTVAIVTQRGIFLLEDHYPFVEILMQVHDSLVFQLPDKMIGELDGIQEHLSTIEVPYADPLRIPWGVAVSKNDWGECL